MDQRPVQETTDLIARRVEVHRRVNTLLVFYAASGAILSVIGFGFLLYSSLDVRLSFEETAALVAAVMGATISILSYALMSFRRGAINRDYDLHSRHKTVGRFLEAWRKLEEVSRHAAYGESALESPLSIREVIAALKRAGKLTVEDVFELEELLRLRNSLVHGSTVPPRTTIDDALNRVIDLLTKLS